MTDVVKTTLRLWDTPRPPDPDGTGVTERGAPAPSRWLTISDWVGRPRGCADCRREQADREKSFERALDSLWLACQPIVSWSSRRAVAFEVLCRSAEPGLENPAALLEAAERLGRVWALGRVVRERAAALMATMPARCALFVNLHPAELEDPELFDPDAPLAGWADRVVLEITERRGIGDMERAAERVRALRQVGYRIAVDDLGAGHSGLSSLAELAPDVVKIDRSLVAGIDHHPLRRKLVECILELCKGIKTRVVAEGVETDAELEALSAIGCDWVQGYLLGAPTPSPLG